MFKRRKRRRRSELRRGTATINYETATFQPQVSVISVGKFWRARGVKLSGLFSLFLLLWAVYTIFSTPKFFIYGADIKGNVAVSSREIYISSGIDSQSVFFLNPAKIVERITLMPNIKGASVSIDLPARVTIEVVERRPELLWQTGEIIWWVDQEGVAVPPKGDIKGMLRIIDDDRQPLEAGQQIKMSIIEGAQNLHILAPDLSIVRYNRIKGLIVATPEGWPVYLGDGSEIKAKLVVLTTLLTDLKERNVTPSYIDLQNPLRAVYHPQAIIRIGQPGQRPPLPLGR